MVAPIPEPREIAFVSSLPQAHHLRLESLLFFNRRQDKVRPGIELAIDRYGPPEIVSDPHGLKVRVAGPVEV